MQLGLHALGIGAGARPDVIRAVAKAAESAGFARLWCGEHLVLVDRPASRYPYAADGRLAVPADADWLDPLLCLTYAAAATKTIGLATGVLLLGEHNPVLTAKQAATLDVLSGGRLTLGVGIGWSAEEFAALGIPFEHRGRRTAEHVVAMRTLWADDVASFHGDFTRFEAVRVNPKPVRDRRIPVVVGGNSDAALGRVATLGDGWYGFNLAAAKVSERVLALAEACKRHGRSLADLSIAVALADGGPAVAPELAQAGVTEIVLVGTPPADPADAVTWVAELAAAWLHASRSARLPQPAAVSTGQPVVDQRHDQCEIRRDERARDHRAQAVAPQQRQHGKDECEHDVHHDHDDKYQHQGAEDVPAVAADKRLAAAERRERPRPLEHDDRDNYGPDGDQDQARHDEQHEPDRDRDAGQNRGNGDRPQVRHGCGHRLAHGQVSAAIPDVLHRLDQRGLQQERGDQLDDLAEQRSERADEREHGDEDRGDEVDDEGDRQQMPRVRAVHAPGLVEHTR
jgi:probable F420-dependent oxidoreductase